MRNMLNLNEIINKIHCSDNRPFLKNIPSESIDSMVTDPPYALEFMSKSWDKVLPPVSTWKECLRILKPGAFAFIMSSPRQDVLSQMIVNLTQAGFKTDFTSIYWSYASGFPKATNISKAVDKKLGLEREITGIGSGSSLNHQNKINLEQGFRPNDYYKEKDSEFEIKNKPISPQATLLNGSYAGFQPKGAVEIIIVTMKPLSEKNYVEQSLKNTKGITWLDNCRIPIKDEVISAGTANSIRNGSLNEHEGYQRPWKQDKELYAQRCEEALERTNKLGRFPANLLVSDDILNNGDITLSSGGKSGHTEEYYDDIKPGFGDSGSFSRYFDLDIWFSEKLKTLPANYQKVFPFIITPKASQSERNDNLYNSKEVIKTGLPLRDGSGNYINNEYGDGSNSIRNTKTRNFHPTIKPISLMSYLITLGSKEQDIILDPFSGSGTTALSSLLLGRKFIAIDLVQEYCDIANERIKPFLNTFEMEKLLTSSESIPKETKNNLMDLLA